MSDDKKIIFSMVKVSKTFTTGKTVLKDIYLSFFYGAKIGILGLNGAGKSTLLKIIAGLEKSFQGDVVFSPGYTVGYLSQEPELDPSKTAREIVMEGAQRVVDLLKEFEEINNKFGEPMSDDEMNKLIERQGQVQDAIDAAGGWELDNKIEVAMDALRCPDPETNVANLSGGEKRRLALCRLLLQEPDVLLLDEPTNHLDISSIQWLEEFLREEYDGSLVLVTHDVALQKRVTDSLAILHGGRFHFRTHQQDYLTFRESLGDEARIVEKQIEATQKKIEENMDFVMRFRAKAQTAARAQSKLKAAETLTEELNGLKDRLNRIQGFGYNLHFHFRVSGTGSKFPLSAKTVDFRYSESAPWILKNVSLDVKRGQIIAIVGDNGAGKTTLLNVLAGRLKPSNGEIQLGHAVQTGYFGQHQLDELSLDDTVFDNLRARANGVSQEQLRGWLGAFGFGGNDEIAKKAKVLSGGEKARLALLRILVTPINLCLLDEPTNHLDIETKALLKEAIRRFEGTSIIVSHDREFIEDLAERVIYLSSDHHLIDHLGNLKTFFEKYPQYVRHLEGRAKPSTMAPASTAPAKPKVESTLSYEERKKVRNQIKSLEKKIAAAEADIERMGHEKEQFSATSDFSALARVEAELHGKMVDWEKWSTELEALRKLAPGQ